MLSHVDEVHYQLLDKRDSQSFPINQTRLKLYLLKVRNKEGQRKQKPKMLQYFPHQRCYIRHQNEPGYTEHF